MCNPVRPYWSNVRFHLLTEYRVGRESGCVAVHVCVLHSNFQGVISNNSSSGANLTPYGGVNFRKISVSFQGPTYYNSIENDIKESNSLHLFKTKLKKNYIWIISYKSCSK